MDSFYDAPRRPPTPTRFEKINFTSLSVPEISIIAPEKPTNPPTTTMQINRQLGQTLNDNEVYFKNCLPSKRVHFQSASTNPLLINDGRTCPTTIEHNKENVAIDVQKKSFDLNGKTFKHIYMANIPNRDLDLSILEHSLVKTKQINDVTSKKVDESIDFGRNFKEFKQKFPITAPRRTENAKTYHTHNSGEIHRNPTTTTTRSLASTSRKVDKSVDCCDLLQTKSGDLARVAENQEPTIKDLLEIIKQQNQQIMSLQQQLFNLQNSLQNSNNQQQPHNDGVSKKFSIDLKATSFEVSFRPQKYQKFHNCEPTIQEIIETSGATKNDNQDELCLNLQQSIDVRETCPSPTPSIRIDMDDMQDYKSDDDDGDNDEISTTLYDDIMGQVNKMLENVRLQNNQRNTDVRETVQEVKEATIRYLNNDGRRLRYKPSEVSFAVKQLLLKYLPDEQLANFKINQPKIDNLPPKLNGNRGINNEFSIATLEYMKKYNLLNNRQQQQQKDCLKRIRQNDNFLDISTLKLQPKLL